MKIYLAGAEGQTWAEVIRKTHRRGLMTFYYAPKSSGAIINLFKELEGLDVFLDSGAFSAHTQGTKIDIVAYGEFIHEHREAVSVYANVDVIGDPVATLKNQRILESSGLHPLPTFHQGEPLGYLREMVQEYDHLALGGMVGGRRLSYLRKWLANCFGIIGEGKKVHGFGMTTLELMKEFPFYSVDSTSWLQGSKTGAVLRFTKDGGLRIIRDWHKPEKIDHKAVILADQDGKKNWRERNTINAIEFSKLEKYLTQLWERRGVKW